MALMQGEMDQENHTPGMCVTAYGDRQAEKPGEPKSLDSADARPTRRRFLRVGKKAAFVVPAVWTLSAQTAMAGTSNPSGGPSCAGAGEICVTNTDCCSNTCAFGRCVGG